MKPLLVVLAMCFLCHVAEAQRLINPEVRYFSWIYLHESSKPIKGVLLETGDSTIQFINESLLIDKKAVPPFTATSIPINSIEK